MLIKIDRNKSVEANQFSYGITKFYPAEGPRRGAVEDTIREVLRNNYGLHSPDVGRHVLSALATKSYVVLQQLAEEDEFK